MAFDALVDLLTAADAAETVDVLVAWIGAATLIRYLFVMQRRRERSPLERRATFLIASMAALCLLRGFAWHNHGLWIGVAMMMPASLLPLAITLFAEGLQRRHMPVWAKGLAVVLTTTCVLTNLASGVLDRDNSIDDYVLAASQIIIMAVAAYELSRRDKASLSRAENGLIQTCVLVVLIALPLAVTDYRFLLGFPPARLGTLAMLLFCYTLVRRPDEHAQLASWIRDTTRLVLRAALVCLLLLLALRKAPHELMFPMYVLATALVFAFSINDRLAHVSARRNEAALLRWLARPVAPTLRAFTRELHHLPLTADAMVLEESELAPYEHDALRAAFTGIRPVRSLAQLRMDRTTTTATEARQFLVARGADELTDLLERSGMTHVAMLSASPLRLLLANVPELPGAEDAELALAAVVRHAPAPEARMERMLS